MSREKKLKEDNPQKPIGDVSGYINRIGEIINEHKDEEIMFVYRGEPKEFPVFGQPGIFRGDYLSKDPFFEKNLLLEMKANRLTGGTNLLEIAIDAQHGGFPSRLLDVSFNSLVALYFACVSRPESREDEKNFDSRVIVYRMKRAYCPTAANVIRNYEYMVNNPDSHINENVFSSNYKLIDHIKVNNRIIAQQGALILFQGKEFHQLPKTVYDIITIDHNKKGDIEKELERFFGISTSSIYPEIEHSIDKIKEKAQYIISDDFSICNEVKTAFANKTVFVENQLVEIGKRINVTEESVTSAVKEVQVLEKEIQIWREELRQFDAKYEKKIKRFVSSGAMNSIPKQYEVFLEQYRSMFAFYIDSKIESCIDDLHWR